MFLVFKFKKACYICLNLIDFSTKKYFCLLKTEFKAKKLLHRNGGMQLSSRVVGQKQPKSCERNLRTDPQRINIIDGKTKQENIGMWIRQRPEPIVTFLSGSVPKTQFDFFMPIYGDLTRKIVKNQNKNRIFFFSAKISGPENIHMINRAPDYQ